MVRISVEKQARIYGLAQEGFPSHYIAKKENVSQSSVVRICNKAEETGTEVIQKVWVEMDMGYINKLIESMPQCINDVYKARRGYTEW
ncbi:4992_t:CDS:2 [Scutellospora calospora]|uniref:4992_t:CDS:1 n=1 Tax=Scutellospora calospora TaxID=85575 RepID=A0ACA9JU64_9GLOM|nr:4992_t:CDS:2 [Scutellospora calospora]